LARKPDNRRRTRSPSRCSRAVDRRRGGGGARPTRFPFGLVEARQAEGARGPLNRWAPLFRARRWPDDMAEPSAGGLSPLGALSFAAKWAIDLGSGFPAWGEGTGRALGLLRELALHGHGQAPALRLSATRRTRSGGGASRDAGRGVTRNLAARPDCLLPRCAVFVYLADLHHRQKAAEISIRVARPACTGRSYVGNSDVHGASGQHSSEVGRGLGFRETDAAVADALADRPPLGA